MKRPLLRLLLAAVLVLAVYLLVRLSVSSTSVPEKLGVLQLERAVTGDDARAIVDRLHGRAVSPSRSTVGIYGGGGGTATLYVSRYARADSAAAVLEKMVEGIDRPGSPFDHLRLLPAAQHSTYMCLGMGQAHFFFACREQLIWLSVDIPLAQAALDAVEQDVCGKGS